MRALILCTLAFVACRRGTPPEWYPDRPLCVAERASVCEIVLDGFQRACTDGKGYKCARCYPTDASLNWCFLDGTTSGIIDGASAADWVTCVSDCDLCTPSEGKAIDPSAHCADPNSDGGTVDMVNQ